MLIELNCPQWWPGAAVGLLLPTVVGANCSLGCRMIFDESCCCCSIGKFVAAGGDVAAGFGPFAVGRQTIVEHRGFGSSFRPRPQIGTVVVVVVVVVVVAAAAALAMVALGSNRGETRFAVEGRICSIVAAAAAGYC